MVANLICLYVALGTKDVPHASYLEQQLKNLYCKMDVFNAVINLLLLYIFGLLLAFYIFYFCVANL